MSETNTTEQDYMPCSELEQSPTISELVPEVIREIGRFLEPSEAVRLSQTCISTSIGLSLRTHSSLTNGSPDSTMTLVGGHHEGNPAICTGVIVPCYDDSLHSVTLKFSWKDQGKGRRKGQLFIVAHEMPKDVEAKSEGYEQSLRDLPFKKKQIIYQSDFAHHKMSSLQVPICPTPNKIYQVWCKVGPESSFSLTFKDICLHTTAFGNRAPKVAFYQFQQEKPVGPPQEKEGWWNLEQEDDC